MPRINVCIVRYHRHGNASPSSSYHDKEHDDVYSIDCTQITLHWDVWYPYWELWRIYVSSEHILLRINLYSWSGRGTHHTFSVLFFSPQSLLFSWWRTLVCMFSNFCSITIPQDVQCVFNSKRIYCGLELVLEKDTFSVVLTQRSRPPLSLFFLPRLLI